MLRLLLALLLLAAACTAPDESTSQPTLTEEPGPLLVGQAQQAAAPALLLNPDGAALAWIDADAGGGRYYLRHVQEGQLGPLYTLPVPARNPFDLMLYPAYAGRYHMLWLDADDSGQLRLYSLLLDALGRPEPSPPVLSTLWTARYTAAPDGEEGLHIVWSGGRLDEPALYYQSLDALGRPQFPQLLATEAEWPALAAGEDALYLFWLGTGPAVYGAQLVDGELRGPRALLRPPPLGPADRLDAFHAALDGEQAWLVWNLTRMNGRRESWLASGPVGGEGWEPPQRLRDGEANISWLRPLTGQHHPLPAAALRGGWLGVGEVGTEGLVNWRPLAETAVLLGPPLLAAAPDGRLFLAWSQPGENAADLLLIEVE